MLFPQGPGKSTINDEEIFLIFAFKGHYLCIAGIQTIQKNEEIKTVYESIS